MYIFCCEKEINSKIEGAECGIDILRDYSMYINGTRVFELNQSSVNELQKKFLKKLLLSEKLILFLGGDHSCTAYLANIFDDISKMIIFDAHNDNELNPSMLKNWNFIAYLKYIQKGLLMGYREKHPLMPIKEGFEVIKDYECKNYLTIINKLDAFCQDTEYMYITIDLDVLSPLEMPGVSFPVSGGLQLTEILYFLDNILKKNVHIIVDIVEFNSKIESKISEKVVSRLMRELVEML